MRKSSKAADILDTDDCDGWFLVATAGEGFLLDKESARTLRDIIDQYLAGKPLLPRSPEYERGMAGVRALGSAARVTP